MTVGRWRLGMAAVSAVLVLLGALGVAAAGADELEFELQRSFGHDGSSVTGFSSATSVAVDRSEGRVYVLDRVADAIYKFDLAGNPVDFGGSSPDVSGNELSGLTIEDTAGGRQIAVDQMSHTIYVPGEDAEGWGGKVLEAFDANGEPSIFTAGPKPGTNEISGFHGLRQIAVDTNGAIYTAERGDETGYGFKVFAPTGAPLVTNPGPAAVVTQPNGLAVNPNGLLYIVRSFAKLARYTPSEFPVTSSTTYSPAGDINSKQVAANAQDPIFHRLYGAERYEEAGVPISRVEVFDEEGNAEGVFGGPGEDGELKNVAGVAVTVVNEVSRAFVAHNPGAGGLSQVRIFNEKVVVGPPSIESTSTMAVSGDSASVRGKVNPNSLDTTYWFEYGLEECEVAIYPCLRAPVDGALIPPGRKGVVVQQALSGLQPQTLYHYRLVAENSEGLEAGPDKTFTTQGSGLGFELGDSRVWEMVSPPRKNSGELVATADAAIQASVSGDRLAFASLGSLFREPDGSRLPEPATVLAQRGGRGEWTSTDLTMPHTTATELRPDTEFNLFSPDLLRGEFEPRDNTPLSPQASEATPYVWEDGDPPLLEPLLTPANVPPGTEFGLEPGALRLPVRIEGASPDLEHVVVSSEKAPLVEGAAPRSVYWWSGGQIKAVSELPQSEGGEVVEGMLGSGRGSVLHAISSDGSRVFWTPTRGYDAAGIALPALYEWDAQIGESVRLDVVSSGVGSGGEHPVFNAASADGHVVFFTDSQRLTADASPSGRDLYRCEVGPVGSGQGCVDLTDVSAPRLGPSESAGVFDQAPAISDDGTRLYFVARGVLDGEANDSGDTAVSGQPNLYLWEEGQGVRFIATLSEADFLVWGGVPSLSNKLGFAIRISASASPDGRYFSFTSERSLTGYDNQSGADEAKTEVFLYDAEAAGDSLSCASCNPSGAAAMGELLPAGTEFFPPDPAGLWRNRWIAATLPEAGSTEPEGRSLYRPRSTLDNGRVFFNSVDPLVPADSNGEWDVYQWEPVGVGSCAEDTSSASSVRSGPGCVGLQSSGTAEGDAGFLDATPSGDDAFFLTKGRLSVLDKDDQLDAYDARVGGIEAVLHPPQECAGEACQPAAAPP
jgi:DNA-binding beta-propeller fold protein YncE